MDVVGRRFALAMLLYDNFGLEEVEIPKDTSLMSPYSSHSPYRKDFVVVYKYQHRFGSF